MLLNVTKSLNLRVPQNEAWQLLRDMDRLAVLIPGVESLETVNQTIDAGASAAETVSTDSQKSRLEEKYAARVVEKVGPFRLDLNLGIRVTEAEAPSLLKAELTGSDRGGQNRIRGRLSAELQPVDADGTLMNFNASVEVLGKLASLGAAPIRRRANELFDVFATRVQQQFASAAEPVASSGDSLPVEKITTPEPSSRLSGPAAGQGKPLRLARVAAGGVLGITGLIFLLGAGVSVAIAVAVAIGLALFVVITLGAIKREQMP